MIRKIATILLLGLFLVSWHGSTMAIDFAPGKEINLIDDQGMKQGYWIIKGYMSDKAGYQPNSTVEEGEYLNNKKQGLWKSYWPNGTLKSEINYEMNRPRGAYAIYYRNGQMEEQGLWERGKNIGQFHRWYDNGQPHQEFHFSDSGKRNGIQKYYHDNGQLELEVNIINGKESGAMKRYDERGKIKQEMTLENGTLVDGSIKNFLPSHKAPEHDPIETIIQEEETPEPIKTVVATDEPNSAHEFKPDGYNVLYNENQQITQIGDFTNGRLWNGKWHRYNPSGILIRIEIYKQGKYVGTGVMEEN
ncbi:MAG: hypothetical protein HKN32_01320 [Flavobacteriales bacterium]|nr:hypothetical protein [Flavobacteriales bacterium]